VYAKWVDVDSTLKWPYATVNTQGQITGFLADSVTNIVVAGRDVRSTVVGGGWGVPQQVTNGTTSSGGDVGAKYTKLAHFAGNGGELHIIFTEWGVGERTDDDPNNSDNIMWYVQGVSVSAPVSVDQVSDVPGNFALSQNYPNPFNPGTQMTFTLPQSGRTSMKVFNALGQEVATVFDEFRTAGTHTAQFNASNLPSGMYLYRLESGAYSASRTMILAK
jgi:hypothetical protein